MSDRQNHIGLGFYYTAYKYVAIRIHMTTNSSSFDYGENNEDLSPNVYRFRYYVPLIYILNLTLFCYEDKLRGPLK